MKPMVLFSFSHCSSNSNSREFHHFLTFAKDRWVAKEWFKQILGLSVSLYLASVVGTILLYISFTILQFLSSSLTLQTSGSLTVDSTSSSLHSLQWSSS